MTEPKFCTACRHYQPPHQPSPLENITGASYRRSTPSQCLRPENVRMNMETGEQLSLTTPELLRNAGASCGTDGKWFEAQPEPQKLGEVMTVDHWPFPEPTPRWKLWLARCLGL